MAETTKLLRIGDLKAMGVVSGWTQLRRLIENHGFPPGYLLGPTTRVWDVDAVEVWLQTRASSDQPGPKPAAAQPRMMAPKKSPAAQRGALPESEDALSGIDKWANQIADEMGPLFANQVQLETARFLKDFVGRSLGEKVAHGRTAVAALRQEAELFLKGREEIVSALQSAEAFVALLEGASERADGVLFQLRDALRHMNAAPFSPVN